MHIEINPKSLQNLEHIVEVLYCLHPSVLDYLVDMERRLGSVLGCIEKNNKNMEEREFLTKVNELDPEKYIKKINYNDKYYEDVLETKDLNALTEDDRMELALVYKSKDEVKYNDFNNLLKYLKLRTDEYIPIKINIEVEDSCIAKKVRYLVRALEKTRAPEQFYLNKRELDRTAFFAEGYNLKLDEDQQREYDKLFWGRDIDTLTKIIKLRL